LPNIGNSTQYYLQRDLTISNGDTLTIEPGVDIYFPVSSRDIIANGVLLAKGTATDTIKFQFTSMLIRVQKFRIVHLVIIFEISSQTLRH